MFHIKLAWIWLKENWKIPFLIVWSVLVWAISRNNAEAALDVLAAKKESYDKQIVTLKENHKKELTKRDLLVKQYHETLKELEEKYQQKHVTLTVKEKQKVKQVVEEMEGDVDAVQKKIEELFNLSDFD